MSCARFLGQAMVALVAIGSKKQSQFDLAHLFNADNGGQIAALYLKLKACFLVAFCVGHPISNREPILKED